MSLVAFGMGAQAVTQGLAGGIALYKGLKQKVDPRTDYTADPTVVSMRNEAKLQADGRMANVGAMERGIEQRGAQTQEAYTRAATDASQAFLGTSATNAQTQAAGLNLAQLEAQDQARRTGRADQTTMLASQERAREIQDQQLKRQEQIAAKTQLITGGLQGITSGFGGLAAIGQYQQGLETTQQQLGMQEAYYNAMVNGGGSGTTATSPSVLGNNFIGGGGMTSGFGGFGASQPMINVPGFGMRPNPFIKNP